MVGRVAAVGGYLSDAASAISARPGRNGVSGVQQAAPAPVVMATAIHG